MDFTYFLLPLSLFTFITLVFLAKNPVYGVLSFVVVVMHVVFLLILLDLEFLAYVLAIVYIGAIVVLFLFVIMMFYIHHFSLKRSIARGSLEYYIVGWLISNIAYYAAFFDAYSYVDFAEITFNNNLIALVAWYLFNDGLTLTVIITLIMLVGIIGAIILTVRTNTVEKPIIIRARNLISDALLKIK